MSSDLASDFGRRWQLAVWVHAIADGGTEAQRLSAAHVAGEWARGPAMSGVERNVLASAVLLVREGRCPAACCVCGLGSLHNRLEEVA